MLPPGQIQAPTGYETPEASAIVSTSAVVESVIPESTVAALVPTTSAVPVVPVPAVPSYPAGNATVVAPSGSAGVSGGAAGGSPTDAAGSDDVSSPEQTGNAAAAVGVPAFGALFAGLMAFLA